MSKCIIYSDTGSENVQSSSLAYLCQMYKAFINDKPVVIGDVYTAGNHFPSFEVMSDSEADFDDVVTKLSESKTKGVLYLSASPLQAWHEFTSRYVLMEAAGGVVLNGSGELLIIFRKKRWDLPKGKLDYGESPEECALREVREECGITDLAIERALIKTFHSYPEKDRFILKKTHWFVMHSEDTGELSPQEEEGIEKVKWMSAEKVKSKVYENTYESIKEVLNSFFNRE